MSSLDDLLATLAASPTPRAVELGYHPEYGWWADELHITHETFRHDRDAIRFHPTADAAIASIQEDA